MKRFYWFFGCVFFISIFLLLFGKPVSWAKEPLKAQLSKTQKLFLLAANSSSPSDQSDIYAQAEELFKKKKFNEVIKLLSGPCYNDPTNYKLNVLLAKAQVEKCAILKEKGDKSYKAIIKQPYITGVRFHKMSGPNPELYYIVAKSLFVNDRLYRAERTIKKALYFSPNNVDYLLVLGDIYAALAEKDKKSGEESFEVNRSFSKARDAYEKAMAIMKKNDVEFRTKIEEKIKTISEKMK